MSSIATSIESFVPDLKKNPRLAYRKFNNRVLSRQGQAETRSPRTTVFSTSCSHSQISTTWQFGHYSPRRCYQHLLVVMTSIALSRHRPRMPLQLHEMSISDRKIVYRALAYLTQKFINSFAPDDISELSDDVYGMMNVTLRQCYVHSEAKYARLDQSDFDKIFETLQSPKLATQDFAALADIHRDIMHQLLASSNHFSTEYMKTQYFMQAIEDDPAGRYATELFLQQYPYIPDDRRFTDLFATVIRQTYIGSLFRGSSAQKYRKVRIFLIDHASIVANGAILVQRENLRERLRLEVDNLINSGHIKRIILSQVDSYIFNTTPPAGHKKKKDGADASKQSKPSSSSNSLTLPTSFVIQQQGTSDSRGNAAKHNTHLDDTVDVDVDYNEDEEEVGSPISDVTENYGCENDPLPVKQAEKTELMKDARHERRKTPERSGLSRLS
eukprot:gene33650-43487_t